MPELPLQLEGSSLRLVLLPSVVLNTQFRGSHQVISCSILFRQKFKQNNHHLLSVKMRPSAAYIGYFQNQLAKVHNCSEDASALAFIRVLRITHLLYKHRLKYKVTHWSEVWCRSQLYIQLEEAMKNSADLSFSRGDDGTEPKLQHGDPSVDIQGCEQDAFKKKPFPQP